MMKCWRVVIPVLALAMWAVAPSRGQDTQEAPASPAATPDATPTAAGNLFPDTGPALPQNSEQGSQGGGRHGHRKGAANRSRNRGHSRDMAAEKADMDPLDVRVAYRRDKTMAMERDPGLADLLREAAEAPTDNDKRAWLKQYYTRLYAGIAKIDPSPAMKAHVALIAEVTGQRWDPKRRAVAGEEDLVNGRRGRRH